MQKFLTTTEAGEIMGCSRWTVERIIRAGKIRAYKPFGPRGKYVLTEDSITEVMRKNALYYRDAPILLGKKKRA